MRLIRWRSCRNFLISKQKTLKRILIASFAVLIFNEWLIYYLVIFQCSWPQLEHHQHIASTAGRHEETLKVMILSDPHLLGPRRGHWFDKLKREWQMFRAFQTAITIFSPEVVFILGDVFDEGLWVLEDEFQAYVARFHSIFKVNPHTKLYVVVGNHDIGFHYVITPNLNDRFGKAFNISSVQRLHLKGNNFVLINSMAMEQDRCGLCNDALFRLQNLSKKLDCEETPSLKSCRSKSNHREYSQPILLQHFPLYRKSDEMCVGVDAAPEEEKNVPFRENWDCLSSSSTNLLLRLIKPRLVLSGHTHHGCLHFHKYQDGKNERIIEEYSVPSFSWRNRDNPSFYLGVFLPLEFKLEKCPMPREYTVNWMYNFLIGGAAIYILLEKFIGIGIRRLSLRKSYR